MLLPRAEGLPEPEGADQHLRQDCAQGKALQVPSGDGPANMHSPFLISSPR
jgi:hypothetical protein